MRAIDPARRAEALRLARAHGFTEAAKRTGIARSTIHSWTASEPGFWTSKTEQTQQATEAALQSWEQRRVELAHRIGQVAERALERARHAIEGGEASDSRAYATTMAILVDKAQLLTGGATTRAEHADPRARVREKLDELEQRRQKTA